MIDKPIKSKKTNIQDRVQPTNVEQLIQKYDLDNIKVYEFLDSLIEYINNKQTLESFNIRKNSDGTYSIGINKLPDEGTAFDILGVAKINGKNIENMQGPKGDTGATGPKGATGPQGIQGIPGTTPKVSIMSARRNRAYFNFANAWTIYNIGLSSVTNKIDNSSLLEFTTSGIKIKSSLIKGVKVSGLVSYNSDAMSGDKLFHILKNNVSNAIGTYNYGVKGWTTAVINEQVILVVLGDVISLGFASGNTGNMEFLESALTVEAIF